MGYTPEEYSYQLVMFEGGGEIQSVELTRDEYIGLKEQLPVLESSLPVEHPDFLPDEFPIRVPLIQ